MLITRNNDKFVRVYNVKYQRGEISKNESSLDSAGMSHIDHRGVDQVILK